MSRIVMPIFLGVISGMASHGLTDPKFWVLIVLGNCAAYIDRKAAK
jgi:hypothetical protein